MSLQRRLRRVLVRLRTSPFSVPLLLLARLRRANDRTYPGSRQLDCGPGNHSAGFCPADHLGLPTRIPARFLRVTSTGLGQPAAAHRCLRHQRPSGDGTSGGRKQLSQGPGRFAQAGRQAQRFLRQP